MKSQQSGKLSRNDPCPCHSGKKYKACCLNKPSTPPLTIPETLNRAWQAVAQRDVVATLHWFRQALQLQPDHPHALAGLGQALCWQQQRQEGLAYLQQAATQLEIAARERGEVRFILELAEQLHHWGDLDSAMRLTGLAIKLDPGNPNALNNHALYLIRVNRHKEALPYAGMACMKLPDDPACNNLLAILYAQLNRLDEAQEKFEAVIQANRDSRQTARAWQELVGVLDKQGRYREAFEAGRRAKSIAGQFPELQRYDARQIFSAIAFNKAGFDQALLQKWPPELIGSDSPAPNFLMGFLRSGTTLTEQVLASHPDILTSDENDLLPGVKQQLQNMTGCGQNIPHGLRQLNLEQIRQLRRFYWRRVRDEYGESALQKRFIDKMALNSIDIGLISVIFPDANILFALRDPRDICLSCFQQAFSPAEVTINLMTWEGVAKQYAAVMDLWLALKPWIRPRYIELRYEDSVQDFENSFRRVFDLLNLPWSEEISRFHEKTKGRYISTPSFAAVSQPIYQTAVARWRHYQEFFPEVLPILDPYINAFGYR